MAHTKGNHSDTFGGAGDNESCFCQEELAAEKKKEMQKRMIDFANAYDWKGLAKAFHEGDMQWHSQEWEELFAKIREEAVEAFRKSAVEAIAGIDLNFIFDAGGIEVKQKIIEILKQLP